MKIYFIGPLESTFVKHDIEIMKKHHTLICDDSRIGTGIKGLFNLCKLSLKACYFMLKSDIFFAWFADYATLMPTVLAKLLGKKSVVVAGGFDVGYIPELQYGAKYNKYRWFCVKNTFLTANKILSVSNYASKSLFSLTSVMPDKVKMIYNCIKSKNYDIKDYLDIDRKYFITTSQAYALNEFTRKGSDKFIETARRNLEKEFILAGLRGDAFDEAMKLSSGLTNINIIKGPLSLTNDIIPLYKQSYAYIQLSLEETFGLSVIEAMRCGCLPIVSNQEAVVEVSGKYGLVCSNESDIDKYIEYAINAENNLRIECSEYSLKFDIIHREKQLLYAIENL